MSLDDNDQAAIETLGASPDPVALAGRRHYAPHPLFPRDDGSPENRDIQYVTFRRRRTGDRLVQNYPEDIPAHEMHSWAQVVAWWGGGEYQVIGKNAKHEFQAVHPAGTDAWEFFDGESKPFMLRDGSPYAVHPTAPVRAAEPPAVAPSAAAPPAPAAPSDLGALLAELVREVRASRAAPPPAPSNDNSVLIALINAQAQAARDAQTAAQTAAAAAAARESENMRAFMSAMLNQRPAEAKPAAEPTTVALTLLKAIRDFTHAAPQGSVAETITQFKVLKELTTPAAPAPAASEIGEIFGGLTTLLQAEAARAATTNAAEQAKPAAPERRLPPPPPRPLVQVPGLGLVDVVRAEPPNVAPSALPARTENGLDLDAIKRDPALRAKVLAALGLDAPAAPVPPAVSAPPASTTPTTASKPPAAPVPPAAAPIEAPAPVAAPRPPVAPALTVEAPAAEFSVPRTADRELDVDALLADPALRARALKALGLDMLAGPAPTGAATSVTGAPALAPASVHVAFEPAPAVSATITEAPAHVDAPRAAPAPDELSSPSATPSPAAPISAATSGTEGVPFAVPQQMPATESPAPTKDERWRAEGSLGSIARMPLEQRRMALAMLPGVGALAGELAAALADVPANAWTDFVNKLPADAVRGLANGPGGRS